jgi:GcrA cell cycle regulator
VPARGVWTAERVELLRSYASAGFTCMQIAREIGVTRNAVIGKLSRLGLSKPRPAARPRDANGARPPYPRPLAPRRLLRALFTATPLVADTPTIVTSARPCTLLELTRDKCRWPIADAGPHDAGFCGNAPVDGLSYCAGHARMAYRAPVRRRAAIAGQTTG